MKQTRKTERPNIKMTCLFFDAKLLWNKQGKLQWGSFFSFSCLFHNNFAPKNKHVILTLGRGFRYRLEPYRSKVQYKLRQVSIRAWCEVGAWAALFEVETHFFLRQQCGSSIKLFIWCCQQFYRRVCRWLSAPNRLKSGFLWRTNA